MHKRRSITVRISEDLLEELKELAKYTGRSLNAEAVHAIKKRCDYFKSRGLIEQHCSQTEGNRTLQRKFTAEELRIANINWVPDVD